MTKTEIEGYLRSLRANAKTAKTVILSRASGLKAAFEIQLDTTYPPDGDPVWLAEYEAAIKACEPHIRRIEQRCDELGIGHRYRPSLSLPHWSYGLRRPIPDRVPGQGGYRGPREFLIYANDTFFMRTILLTTAPVLGSFLPAVRADDESDLQDRIEELESEITDLKAQQDQQAWEAWQQDWSERYDWHYGKGH